MRLIVATSLLLPSALTACAPDTADSGPSYPGWALEAAAEEGSFLVEAGNVHEWSVEVFSSGVPCEGCTVEQQAQLVVTLDVKPVDAPANLKVALVGPGLRVEREVDVDRRQSVLLVGPVFQGCTTAPECSESVRLEVLADAPVRGSHQVSARAESTHDAEDWQPAATLGVRLR